MRCKIRISISPSRESTVKRFSVQSDSNGQYYTKLSIFSNFHISGCLGIKMAHCALCGRRMKPDSLVAHYDIYHPGATPTVRENTTGGWLDQQYGTSVSLINRIASSISMVSPTKREPVQWYREYNRPNYALFPQFCRKDA